MNSLTARIRPFLTVGIGIALFILGLMIFSYILVFVVLAGIVLFAVSYLRIKLGYGREKSNKNMSAYKGRIIEHEKE